MGFVLITGNNHSNISKVYRTCHLPYEYFKWTYAFRVKWIINMVQTVCIEREFLPTDKNTVQLDKIKCYINFNNS